MMKTMGSLSSKPKPTLYCCVRKKVIADTPEEQVRQHVLAQLLGPLGYPAAGIVLERALLKTTLAKAPGRRTDIICFAKGNPILLIECKAVPLTSGVIRQVVGYNHYVQARYVAIVNQTEARVGWYDQTAGDYIFRQGLPTYFELTH